MNIDFGNPDTWGIIWAAFFGLGTLILRKWFKNRRLPFMGPPKAIQELEDRNKLLETVNKLAELRIADLEEEKKQLETKLLENGSQA